MLSAAGCSETQEQPEQRHFARVGNNQLTLQEARSALPDMKIRSDSVRALLDYRSKWVRKQLMLQEAGRLKLERNPSVQKEINRIKKSVFIDALQNYVLENRQKEIETTREEARDYYQQHKDKFTLQERFVRFRHMETNTLNQAEKAKSELLGGISWDEVARKYHVKPASALNHSRKYRPISMAISEVPRMQQFLEVIGIREISPIRRANGNFHFVQLMEEQPKGYNPDLEWALEHIEEWLKIKKKKDVLNAYVKNLYLRARANNEIEMSNVFDSDTTVNRPFNDTTQNPIHD